MEQRSGELPEEAWREITVAEGSQGPRSYMFSARRVRITKRRKPGEEAWAIWRRNLDGRASLLPVQRPGGHSPGDAGLCGRFQVANRNGVRDGEERRGAGRVRDPELGWLASPHSHVPAGWSLSPTG